MSKYVKLNEKRVNMLHLQLSTYKLENILFMSFCRMNYILCKMCLVNSNSRYGRYFSWIYDSKKKESNLVRRYYKKTKYMSINMKCLFFLFTSTICYSYTRSYTSYDDNKKYICCLPFQSFLCLYYVVFENDQN